MCTESRRLFSCAAATRSITQSDTTHSTHAHRTGSKPTRPRIATKYIAIHTTPHNTLSYRPQLNYSINQLSSSHSHHVNLKPCCTTTTHPAHQLPNTLCCTRNQSRPHTARLHLDIDCSTVYLIALPLHLYGGMMNIVLLAQHQRRLTQHITSILVLPCQQVHGQTRLAY